MEIKPQGLLKCARIAFPGYDWVYVNGVIRIKPKHSGKINTIDEFFDSVPKTFLLDNDSDVLALIEGLGKHGICARPLDTKWYPSNTKYKGTMPIHLHETLTDCLYAAAQEVGE